jgi:hypothetical protein
MAGAVQRTSDRDFRGILSLDDFKRAALERDEHCVPESSSYCLSLWKGKSPGAQYPEPTRRKPVESALADLCFVLSFRFGAACELLVFSYTESELPGKGTPVGLEKPLQRGLP